MARQIIVLEDQNPSRGDGDPISYRYAFWLTVPTARQSFYANASATSRVKDATTAEITAIQNGSIKETVDNFSAAAGTTLAQIQTGLVAQFNAAQAVLNSSASNAWNRYGTFYDGSAWTMKTTA